MPCNMDRHWSSAGVICGDRRGVHASCSPWCKLEMFGYILGSAITLNRPINPTSPALDWPWIRPSTLWFARLAACRAACASPTPSSAPSSTLPPLPFPSPAMEKAKQAVQQCKEALQEGAQKLTGGKLGDLTWSYDRMPDLSGKPPFIVTGGNAGLGLEACKHLAAAGATVVMAGATRPPTRSECLLPAEQRCSCGGGAGPLCLSTAVAAGVWHRRRPALSARRPACSRSTEPLLWLHHPLALAGRLSASSGRIRAKGPSSLSTWTSPHSSECRLCVLCPLGLLCAGTSGTATVQCSWGNLLAAGSVDIVSKAGWRRSKVS